jgi:hypothetical protein
MYSYTDIVVTSHCIVPNLNPLLRLQLGDKKKFTFNLAPPLGTASTNSHVYI